MKTIFQKKKKNILTHFRHNNGNYINYLDAFAIVAVSVASVALLCFNFIFQSKAGT